MLIICGAASLTNLTCVILDRYISIIHPFAYNRIVSEKRAKCAIISTWVLSIILGCIPHIWNYGLSEEKCTLKTVYKDSGFQIFLMVGIITELVIISLMYCNILIKAYKQARRINSFSNGQTPINIRTNRQVLSTIGIIVVVFLICWIPILVAITDTVDITVYGRSLLVCLNFLNSGINPIVYGLRLKDFRTSYKKLLCLEKKSSRNAVQSTEHTLKTISCAGNENCIVT